VLKDQIRPGNCLVEADYSGFARMFEKAMLKMDKLTPHQEAKLSECLEDGAKRVHVVAPAGAGKTFVALCLIIDFLQKQDDACVLFVARNCALAFFVAKWLCAREHGPELLQRLYLLYEPLDQLQPHKVVNNGWKLVADYNDPLPTMFGMVCIDEAHHLFGMTDQRATSILDKFCGQDDVRLVLLSDVSQSRDSTIKYPPDLRKVELTEIVRNSERIVLAASAFQLQEDKSRHVSSSSQHGVTGPPLVSVLFDEKSKPGSPEWYDAYAKHINKALKEKVISKFRGLNLHDRLVILVPDEVFKEEITSRLSMLLEGYETRKFKLVSADEASEAVTPSSRDVSSSSDQEWLVLETMDKFDGLERLIVMVVGMDQAGAAIKGRDNSILLQTRSLLYRAVTRAHMYVCVVNVLQKEGLLSFLMHVKLEADARSSKARQVIPLTAQALVESPEEEASAIPAGDNNQEATKLGAQESHSSTVRHADIDAYVLDKERRSNEKKTGKKKRKMIANNLWDPSGNDAAHVPSVLPDFMPFDLGDSRVEELEEQQKVRVSGHPNLYEGMQFHLVCVKKK